MLISGKKITVSMNFLLLVLKCLNFYCFMLQSQKMKCLVLSRYPHSDPHTKVIRRFGSFYMKNSIAHRRAIIQKTIMSTWGLPCRVLHFRNLNPKISCNPVIPLVVFGIPPLAQTSNPESRPDFAFKSRKTY